MKEAGYINVNNTNVRSRCTQIHTSNVRAQYILNIQCSLYIVGSYACYKCNLPKEVLPFAIWTTLSRVTYAPLNAFFNCTRARIMSASFGRVIYKNEWLLHLFEKLLILSIYTLLTKSNHGLHRCCSRFDAFYRDKYLESKEDGTFSSIVRHFETINFAWLHSNKKLFKS